MNKIVLLLKCLNLMPVFLLIWFEIFSHYFKTVNVLFCCVHKICIIIMRRYACARHWHEWPE